ncbi:PREDICTED: guanine nucleotide-binding protein G(I)/G(S)/G(O) subunit gamma-10 [Ficedula albicollis]|uniref:guanine nucleotide-binding protein G(I)/G(S)/G(O) subunit gamma-10 n=1 Tax=Ficedula albicollis TaxID=59894 RepID=UPI0007AD8114|nr:PREDICTED: guanine nucleotide-binding protein G(I)/G(S)/G(O) subunit gamma-10 [Ficedula albicollis]
MPTATGFLSGIFFPFQVSQAAAELQQYCMQNACKDALLVGVPAGSNPFREPRSCALL